MNTNNKQRRPRNRGRKADQLLNEIQQVKDMEGIANPPSYKQVAKAVDRETMRAVKDVVNKDGNLKMSANQLNVLLDFVNKIAGSKPLPYMETLVGRKFMKSVEPQFSQASPQQQRKMLELALADDFGASSLVTGALKYAAPHALKYVWDTVKDRTPIKKIRSWLKDTLGFDMNDDLNINRFNYNASPLKTIDWQNLDDSWMQRSLQFNGVAVQAICSVLFPEYTSCRIPSDSSIKSALYSRVFSTTITTNASGNAIFAIAPDGVFANGTTSTYYNVYNGADLDINTGAQTASASYHVGPLYTYLTQATQFRVTATVVEISYITSPLNTQGRVVGTMYQRGTPFSQTQAPTGLNDIRDREYVTYTAMPQINGHRFVHINNDLVPGEFRNATGGIIPDVIQFIVSGAVASTAVIQVNVYFQVEMIVVNSLADIGYPPAGPATQMALKEILRMPRLRLLGHQEATELYEVLASSEPTYEAVLSACRGIRFNHRHDYVGFGSTGVQGSQGLSKQDFQPQMGPQLVTM